MELFSLGSLRLDGLQLHGSLDRKVLKKGLKKRCPKKSQDAVCVIVCYWEIGGIRWYCNHEKQLSASYSLLQSLRRHLSFHVGFKVLEQKLPGSNATYAKSSCIWHVCVLESSISSICVRPISLLNLTLFACWIHPVPWSVLGEMTSTSSDSSGPNGQWWVAPESVKLCQRRKLEQSCPMDTEGPWLRCANR